ncbi:MAG TPA: lysozyme inhibitor LprI family protein [Paludibacter sp.]
MKQFLFVLFALLICPFSYGQNNGPEEITPGRLQTIKAAVDKQANRFKVKLVSNKELTKEQIEFSVDTFKIERIAAKCIEIDYSTMGMVQIIDELTASYDILLNKYYKRLLNALKEEDKKTLIAAQKAWIGYRDAEAKLIGTMTKEEYSGGGTIQSNIATGSYSDLVIKRANEIFNYYNEMEK